MSWHATPFEERLEKALSEDTLISQRYVYLTLSIIFCLSLELFLFFLDNFSA